MRCWSRFALLSFLILGACTQNRTAQEIALAKLSPYRKNHVDLSSHTEGILFQDGQNQQILPYLAENFQSEGDLNPDELEKIKKFVLQKSLKPSIHIKLLHQKSRAGHQILRFQQYWPITNSLGREVFIPLKKAQALVYLDKGKLVRVKSSLRSIGFEFSYTLASKVGFVFDFNEAEKNRFIWHLKKRPKALRKLNKLLKTLNSKGLINLKQASRNSVDDLFSQINLIFGSLPLRSLIRFLVFHIEHERISLVKYKNYWGFELSNFLDLPIEFDLAFGEAVDSRLHVKNFRESFRTAQVQTLAFESHHYPSLPKVTGIEKTNVAGELLSQVVTFFNQKFLWLSYQGQGNPNPVEVHIGVMSLDFRGNASWVGSENKILVGEDEGPIHSLAFSPSIMAHEFSHAVTENSSGLLYQGESGAIDEHFADVMGVFFKNSRRAMGYELSYAIGESSLRGVGVPEVKLLNYADDEIQRFNLRSPASRNLYAPSLSLQEQFEHYSQARLEYPLGCVPSYWNDNCGVHKSSGVLNRAMALVIAVESLDRLPNLIFDTVAYHLLEGASFKDYASELQHQCVQNYSAEDSLCQNIQAGFASVGL